MRMFIASIDVQIMEYTSGKSVAGQHAFYGVLDNFSWVFSKQLGRSGKALTTRIAGVANVLLFFGFFAGKNYFVGIDNNNIVAAIDMRSKAWFMFATQNVGYNGT